MKIRQIRAREILDSRATPTIECVITLDNEKTVTASVPSGASVGKYEACELRDNDSKHFAGKGVRNAIDHIHTTLAPLVVGKIPDVQAMDEAMIVCDGTSNKTRLGANALLAVSIAVIRAQALCEGLELYKLINKLWHFPTPQIPLCMFNVINGGMHASSGLSFQECMIMPTHTDYNKNLETAAIVYAELKKLLHVQGYATTVGDEGGFAPQFTQVGLEREHTALELLQQAIKHSAATDVSLCLDVAASHFYDEARGVYCLHNKDYSAQDMVVLYQQLAVQFPIVSIEDGLDQDDWSGWHDITKSLGGKLMLVGDDIFVTNQQRIQQGFNKGVANAVLIKPNQIGTVSEAMQAIKMCQASGYKTVISHRSGETNDDFIADVAVGTAAGYLKAGAPARGERVAKYNRLTAIAEILE